MQSFFLHFTAHKRSCGKVKLFHLSDSVHGGGGFSVRGVSFQVGLCPGGVSVTETPSYGEERAVRILLECIFVLLFVNEPSVLLWIVLQCVFWLQ